MSARLLVRQASRFVVVGGLATAVHVAAALAARTWLHASPLAANFTGYVCAVLVSYLGNSRWSFEQAHAWPQFARFLVMSLSGLALNQALTWLTTSVLGLPFGVALALTVVAVPAFSFVLARLWVFRPAA